MANELYPHTQVDIDADNLTMQATDEAFAQFAPTRDTLPPAAISHPLVRVFVVMGHGLEFMGRAARTPSYIEKVINPERERVGLGPL